MQCTCSASSSLWILSKGDHHNLDISCSRQNIPVVTFRRRWLSWAGTGVNLWVRNKKGCACHALRDPSWLNGILLLSRFKIQLIRLTVPAYMHHFRWDRAARQEGLWLYGWLHTDFVSQSNRHVMRKCYLWLGLMWDPFNRIKLGRRTQGCICKPCR